jgi:GNAT superfamily N-acetyltransferase
MKSEGRLVTVGTANVDELGFFCYLSKRKSEGYQRKLRWLKDRFAEGMKIKMILEAGRPVGFIEYIPGDWTWRAVRAEGYAVVHCMWVVGRWKKKGYGRRLVDACVRDARKQGLAGVAMVTSSSTWLAGNDLLLKRGFGPVDRAPPTFELLVKRFGDAPLPSFPTDWDKRMARYGRGLTVVRTDQCPYVEAAVGIIADTAGERGIDTNVVELRSSKDVQSKAPSAYGVFNVVYDGELLSYRYLVRKEVLQHLDRRMT